jgi:hypothetical protein
MACALVEDVVEGAVLVATVTTIQFLRDVITEATGIGGHECMSNHQA